MGRCNLCTLKGFEKLADQTGQCITIWPATWRMGGYEVMMHKPDEPADKDKNWCAWLMGIPDHCCCSDGYH